MTWSFTKLKVDFFTKSIQYCEGDAVGMMMPQGTIFQKWKHVKIIESRFFSFNSISIFYNGFGKIRKENNKSNGTLKFLTSMNSKNSVLLNNCHVVQE